MVPSGPRLRYRDIPVEKTGTDKRLQDDDGNMQQNNNEIKSTRTVSVIYNRYLMKKINKVSFLSLVTMTAIAFASVDSLYEIDGSAFNERNKTKGPKALVKIERHKTNENFLKEKSISANIPVQDTFHVSLKKGVEQWLELEKITDYSYKKTSDSCIQLNSGNYVKSGKIQYATKMGNGYTFHLLIGMKYIDLRGKRHLLGYNGKSTFTRYGKVIYYDCLRHEEMDEVLVVDKYKVTACEFVQTLWDSIPSELGREPFYLQYSDNNLFWINKKKSMIKGNFCATFVS